ncbi:acyl-coenzyme A thioesterase 1-like [Sardina pilchardus]|uniref:acyl-coenzyme A thioesterase 1-like n=1 Tax=Sardina pilchardus TaxID=27697 RepID=UPI002E0FD5AB
MALLNRSCLAACRKCLAARMSGDSRVSLQLSPWTCSYFDEPVHMEVDGLPPEQSVEMRSKLTDSKGVSFQASATFYSDKNGHIDVDKCPSMGGSYIGIEPMGLFSSMQPLVPHSRLIKRDVSAPLSVDIEVVCDGQIVAQETLERRCMADDVQRFPLEDGNIRGSLFVPPGPGPFPAILDIPHLGGGLTELRASLLAKKGYVVMALAYHGYQDLPKVLMKLDVEYLEEAVAFLRAHPKVKGPGIGILSISKGGDLALTMSALLPGISATVCINGCNGATAFPIHYKGTVIPPINVDNGKIIHRKDGLLDVRDAIPDPMLEENRASVIPIERASCHFLFVAAEDDRNWNSLLFSEQAAQRLRDHGKDNYELVRYPKAGHFLDVPYTPHCPSSFHPAAGTVVVLGGEPKAHAEAQVDLWERVQQFFRRHLNSGHSKWKAML